MPLGMLVALAGTPAGLVAAEPGGAPQAPLDPQPPATTDATEPAALTSEPPAVDARPPSEPPLSCEPQCPTGAVCHEGQCIMTCDPSCAPGDVCAAGECRPALASGPREPVPVRAETPPEPASEAFSPSLSLEVAPGVAACLGEGCRRIEVGESHGAMGVGGSLALGLAYRMTPHLSLGFGGLAAIHRNDFTDTPTTMWFATHVGPRVHLFGGRWRAEPVIGLAVGYARSLVRWSNAGTSADGLTLGVDVGVEVRVSPRISLGMTTAAILPYWARACTADQGVRDCDRRSEIPARELERYFWSTSLVLIARLF
jgi:hypothetical protein